GSALQRLSCVSTVADVAEGLRHDVLKLHVADRLQTEGCGALALRTHQVNDAREPRILAGLRVVELRASLKVRRRNCPRGEVLRVAAVVETEELHEDRRSIRLLRACLRVQAERPTTGRRRSLAAFEGGERSDAKVEPLLAGEGGSPPRAAHVERGLPCSKHVGGLGYRHTTGRQALVEERAVPLERLHPTVVGNIRLKIAVAG